jgi:putative endonuclease
MSLWRRRQGQQGEALAAAYLQQQGYRIQNQNYRCRHGEIDIIAWDGPTLVFVEVKTKGQLRFGPPQVMVDWRKQQKIARIAMTYVQQQALHNTPVRFDVVAILLLPSGRPEVTHLPAAFSPPTSFYYY